MNIELARNEDAERVLKLIERLAEFDRPFWRSEREIVRGDQRVIERYFSLASSEGQFPEGQLLFVARANNCIPGLVLLERRLDYFSQREVLHVSVLAVDRLSEGQGIGTALMHFAESKALEFGIDTLSLNVFGANRGARSLYDKLGFQEEIVGMIKKVN